MGLDYIGWKNIGLMIQPNFDLNVHRVNNSNIV